MTLTPDQVEIIRQGVEAREANRDPDQIRGIDRVDIEVVEGLAYRAREVNRPQAVMTVDEPPERAGTNLGSSPLGHFLTGAGSCLLNQFIRVTAARGYDLRFIRVRVRGEFRRHVGGGFEHLLSEVYAEGKLSEEQARALTDHAEALCYVHATLSRTIKMTTVLYLGGDEAIRKVSTPG